MDFKRTYEGWRAIVYPLNFLTEYICNENLVSLRGENGTMAKAKIDRITEKFTQLVIKLEVMARDTESVRKVCMETLSGRQA